VKVNCSTSDFTSTSYDVLSCIRVIVITHSIYLWSWRKSNPRLVCFLN